MKKEILYRMKSPFCDDFRVIGYTFGEGEKALCVLGAMRGNEVPQQYVCSQLVRTLALFEGQGFIANGVSIRMIPSANPFSMNIGKRFWAMDDTDINRMFPGYCKGETTQRIADGVFKAVHDYSYWIQIASYYMPEEFIAHARIIRTGLN